MKRFEVYRDIRRKAIIFGLPLSLFALMMVAIIASLLIIIFSFGFGIIIGVLVFNCSLYIALMRLTQKPQLIKPFNPFPKGISNKRTSALPYEND